MKLSQVLLIAAAAVSLSHEPGHAGPNNNAKLLIHLARVDKVNICGWPLPNCVQIRTNSTYFGNYHCPLLVTDGDAAAGISEIECGIDYVTGAEGLYVGWFTCADQEFPTAGPNGPWPSPLSSNRIVWNSATRCQRSEPGGAGTGVVAIAGSFYISPYYGAPATPSQVFLIPSPQTGLALVRTCVGEVDTVEGGYIHRDPSHLGFITLSGDGNVPGYNPCGLNTAAFPSTWSRIKAIYSN